jgi:hypothetical protein
MSDRSSSASMVPPRTGYFCLLVAAGREPALYGRFFEGPERIRRRLAKPPGGQVTARPTRPLPPLLIASILASGSAATPNSARAPRPSARVPESGAPSLWRRPANFNPVFESRTDSKNGTGASRDGELTLYLSGGYPPSSLGMPIA